MGRALVDVVLQHADDGTEGGDHRYLYPAPKRRQPYGEEDGEEERRREELAAKEMLLHQLLEAAQDRAFSHPYQADSLSRSRFHYSPMRPSPGTPPPPLPMQTRSGASTPATQQDEDKDNDDEQHALALCQMKAPFQRPSTPPRPSKSPHFSSFPQFGGGRGKGTMRTHDHRAGLGFHSSCSSYNDYQDDDDDSDSPSRSSYFSSFPSWSTAVGSLGGGGGSSSSAFFIDRGRVHRDDDSPGPSHHHSHYGPAPPLPPSLPPLPPLPRRYQPPSAHRQPCVPTVLRPPELKVDNYSKRTVVHEACTAVRETLPPLPWAAPFLLHARPPNLYACHPPSLLSILQGNVVALENALRFIYQKARAHHHQHQQQQQPGAAAAAAAAAAERDEEEAEAAHAFARAAVDREVVRTDNWNCTPLILAVRF